MAAEESKTETTTTTIEIDKDVFLRFKALCVLSEATISGEIEKLMRKRIDELGKEGTSVKRE